MRFRALIPLLAVGVMAGAFLSGCGREPKYLPASPDEAEQMGKMLQEILVGQNCEDFDQHFDWGTLGLKVIAQMESGQADFDRGFVEGMSKANSKMGGQLCGLIENGYEVHYLGHHAVDGEEWVAFLFNEPLEGTFVINEFEVKKQAPTLLNKEGKVAITDVYLHGTGGTMSRHISDFAAYSAATLDGSAAITFDEMTDLSTSFQDGEYDDVVYYCHRVGATARAGHLFCVMCTQAALASGDVQLAQQWQTEAFKTRPDLYGSSLLAYGMYAEEDRYDNCVRILSRCKDRLELPCTRLDLEIAICHLFSEDFDAAAALMDSVLAPSPDQMEETTLLVAINIYLPDSQYDKVQMAAQSLVDQFGYVEEDILSLFEPDDPFLDSPEFKSLKF